MNATATPQRIGAARAIKQRAFRKGYKRAVDDLVVAVAGKVSGKTYGRLVGWQRKVHKWLEALSVASPADAESDQPPLPLFRR